MLRDILLTVETSRVVTTGDPFQMNHSSDAARTRWWLIETNMSRPTDTEYLKINSTCLHDLPLIFLAEFINLILGDFSRRYMNVFLGDIDVIEELCSHKVMVAFRIAMAYRIVFVQVEGHYILKR